MLSVTELMASEPETLQKLWNALLDVGVGMTRETYLTLESMLSRGESARDMAARLGISVGLAHTRRARNGKAVLSTLLNLEQYVPIFKEIFGEKTETD